MKKLLTITLAIAMVFGVALTAQAINTVQMTLTSPAITKTGCEKVGSATFGFDAASQIDQGDWWYMDLPSGTTICNTVDYVLVGNTTVNDATSFVNLTNATTLTAAFSGADGVGNTAPGFLNAGFSDGPFSLTALSAAVGTPITLTGNMAFHVYAPANGRRVWMYAYGEAGSRITVPAGTQFNIKVMDGNAYNKQLLLDRGTGAVAGDGLYGNSTDDEINAARPVPHIENTLCVNAENMSGDLMFTSFFSKDNKFTFTGDSQIAHVAAANPITLAFCKGDTTGNIEIGAQNACDFAYETGTNYCTGFTGNHLLIQGSSVFGDIGDRWDISVVSDTAGVYFNGPFTVTGFTPSEDPCTAGGAAVVTGAIGQFLSNGNAASGLPGNSCSVSAANRVVNLKTSNGGVHDSDLRRPVRRPAAAGI